MLRAWTNQHVAFHNFQFLYCRFAEVVLRVLERVVLDL